MSLLSTFQVEKQKVDDAINVVCDRLEHATLLQDRRAAVLSLKGFARDYKEAVTAGGLRGLLRSLTIDRDDEEILNATLECLLTLFTVDDGGHADDTALWIADEFTLRPENTHVLLDIIVDNNFYTRLRSIQILASILECRAQQLQECVMNSPTGISALVGILDDPREQIRNEGLLLLLKLVRYHTELQKRVAFENAFEKVITIVDAEGGLEGGIITSDCFTLLHNLLVENLSNQNWFRETDLFRRITDLLQAIDKEAVTLSPTCLKNTVELLEIVRLFVLRGSHIRFINQNAYMKAGLLTRVIGLSFADLLPSEIRAEALLTLADLMYNNKDLQDYFVKASSMVLDPLQNSKHDSNDISTLLTILLHGDDSAFAIRYASALCIEAFATGNKDRRLAIVTQLVDSYRSERPHNLLESLISPSAFSDQHTTWFAACSLLHLTLDDEDARDILTDLSIGNASIGEEEVSLIQTFSACLVGSLQLEAQRSAIAYGMVLASWLYEAPNNVADFLEEVTTLQALLSGFMNPSTGPCLKGVLACLLSIAYAFDFSAETTVNRTELRTTLLRLGRDPIVGAITILSQSEEVRLLTDSAASIPRPLLDVAFVHFFRDNFGTIRKAIDQPPNPPRSKREEEAQEEQDRTEDIIADLEAELERKSSGLEEAVNIIKTRQEELQRLREEVKYITQKHEVEFAQYKQEIDKLRGENASLRSEATVSSDDIDKALRENAILHDDLSRLQHQSAVHESERNTAHEKLHILESAVASEASKRGFLEKEMTGLREASAQTTQDLETSRSRIATLEHDLEEATNIARSTGFAHDAMIADLTTARQLQKKAEADANISRTRARDLDSELKGLQHEAKVLEAQHAKELSALGDNLKSTQQDLTDLKDREASLQTQLEKSKDSLNPVLRDLKQQHSEEVQKLVDSRQIVQGDLIAAQAEVARLQAIAAKSQDKTVDFSNTAPPEPDMGLEIDARKIVELESQVAALEHDKLNLQKQLEQAQEDLMLLMEDAGDEETEHTEAD
ncbi:putative Intracellular protein transport protein [Taphrina deformans PYCC 5710]|uniref:Intracellular protein transport protein n=1 Tax=Taphrina deformans (strain PYCC 5710 / ATCC 11124 / CBS 356.35 / IMI 108563 / JCM 9778 / NBRC 8474) TaxID=1097556 RepID=R4X889_TAPDE|nr:putative Intracellular protein transport protein [Taphrina deformans PYCC 5710]|eukprot:CCG81738.1 putative Intracellular protein transport protein [Taphrina deformans PYCC 5710]